MNYLQQTARNLSEMVKPIDDVSGAIEAMALALVSRLASWGASLPNMVMVARSARQIFGLGQALSFVVAASLELVGHALVSHWQEARSWNQARNKTDPAANAALALAMVIGYFALDFSMVAVLALSLYQATGQWTIFVSLAYPLIGISVAIVTNERAALFRIKQQAEQARQERSQARQKGRKRTRQQPAEIAAPGPEESPIFAIAGNSAGRETRAQAMAILAERPGITGSELGRKLGRSPRLGRQLKAELMPERGNGHRH